MPMAGEGSRFKNEGYKLHKPVIPTTDWRTGQTVPMVIAAAKDLPGIKTQDSIIFIDRSFHKTDGVQDVIKLHFPNSKFVTLKHLTEGQACSCLEAKNLLDLEDELVIGGCDNGMIFSLEEFITFIKDADVIIFTYRNNEAVSRNPDAYGWVQVDNELEAKSVSVKKAISSNPMRDHAIASSFWYRKAKYFVEAAEMMIQANDRINNEFYIDQSLNYCIQAGLRVKVFEINKYLCWGTPADYETYESTIKYWKNFNEKIRG